MKNFIRSVLIGTSFLGFNLASIALADEAAFTINKTSFSGHTPAEWEQFENCRLSADKMTRSFRFGSLLIEEETALKMTVQFDPDFIQKLQLEPVVKSDNFLCDGPSTRLDIETNDKSKPSILIYYTGGCGQDKEIRQGPLSSAITNMMDKYCSKTY
ncbi:MAG: hypothetical protein KBD78_07040 [Oligoflexales bacterium]|nr:hypothetical protein [Oligoflexales bacterium]